MPATHCASSAARPSAQLQTVPWRAPYADGGTAPCRHGGGKDAGVWPRGSGEMGGATSDSRACPMPGTAYSAAAAPKAQRRDQRQSRVRTVEGRACARWVEGRRSGGSVTRTACLGYDLSAEPGQVNLGPLYAGRHGDTLRSLAAAYAAALPALQVLRPRPRPAAHTEALLRRRSPALRRPGPAKRHVTSVMTRRDRDALLLVRSGT